MVRLGRVTLMPSESRSGEAKVLEGMVVTE